MEYVKLVIVIILCILVILLMEKKMVEVNLFFTLIINVIFRRLGFGISFFDMFYKRKPYFFAETYEFQRIEDEEREDEGNACLYGVHRQGDERGCVRSVEESLAEEIPRHHQVRGDRQSEEGEG